MKVMVYKGTSLGFKQVGERKVRERANGNEYVIVNGRKRGFDWVSVKKRVVHIG